jgi:hypothetical protein
MRQIDQSMAKPTTNRVIFENDVGLITFTVDGHLLHTHKATFAQRHSLGTWSNFESRRRHLRPILVTSDGETPSNKPPTEAAFKLLCRQSVEA